MAENMIKLGIKLDSNGAEKELQGTIKKLSNNNVKIKFDDKNINFSNINKQLSEIQNKLQQAFNFNTINKSAQESAKVFQGLADEIGKFHEKSDLKITTKEGLQEAKEVNQSLEQQYQAQLKINNLKNSLQTKLTTSKSNGFIDTSTIAELQNKLNSINTNTPEKEIKELESAIKNLASSDSNIVRVQNALSKFSTSYDNIKNKLKDGSLIADDQTEAKLKEYESELRKLKQLQNELQGGKAFSGSKITSELNGITNASRQLNNTLESNMHTSESFGTRIKDALGNMGVYFTAYQGVMLGVNALKDAVETVTSIDTKMRDLRRVTDDATSETLNNFPKQANEMAISLGQTTENAIQATTVWKQLGYTWEEATQYLSKESMILSNVGDMSAEDSTNALVSTLKAFKLEAKDTTSVVDSLNEAGNRFAIKTGELAEGLRVGGASLAIANNSLEQSEALIITGTEVLRDSNEVANGLKTIAMRLDQVKTAKGDTFYKLQSDLKNLAGTELTDANGNLRSTYDIILDLSKVWDSLSDMNQAKLLDEIAGKNQSKVLSAILQNAQQLPKAYDSMKNSAGSASKEQERYMDSIEAKTNALKESVKKLWIEMISSDTIKQFVDFLTSIVTALSNVDSGTVKLIATFTVLGLALKSIGTFTTALQTVGTVANLGKDAGAIGTLVKGFSGIGTSISGMTSSALAFISTPLGATLTGLAVATGVAVAGYEEYQDIMSKPTLSTTTDDLSTFGKVVNSVTGNVVKSKQELILAGSAYEDFSDDLSDKFKNSVEDASKSFNKLRMSLQFDGEQEIFSDKMSQGIKEQVDQIVKTAKQSVMDKRSEVQDTFTTLFSGDGLLDDNDAPGPVPMEPKYQSTMTCLVSLPALSH
jgi:TP901 family phage tail tape measure protein